MAARRVAGWLAVVALACTLSACGQTPDPHGAEVEAARDAAAEKVAALGPEVWGLGEPLAGAARDVCQKGQRNWKVKEARFACTLGRSWVLPGAAADDEVRAQLRDLQARAEQAGCAGFDDLRHAQEYWRAGQQDDPGRLPGGRYTCGAVDLELTPASPTESYLAPISLIGSLTGEDVAVLQNEEFPADLDARVRAFGGVLVWQVTASSRYVEQP